ncbi:hypothetical protein [Sphingobium sp. WCS2017Hpa-17]|uniref:hypothetical protein n=1 Tax=Sphingobium sp. WCS2017Hpa-17 TaxID=3073638 RepID=UPI00288A3356|nr:hypothetical protein [Sphingobium sp. WCS2017Hpa-17]
MRHDPLARLHALRCLCGRCAPHRRRRDQLIELALSAAITVTFAGALNAAGIALLMTIANQAPTIVGLPN